MMPKLAKTFSAFPVSVVLDASGNGVVAFGPNGSNVRITNRSVKVTTATKQAVVTTYRQNVGDNYRIDGTNSGSTGDSNTASIDLRDGELVYVVWSGGDAGATATVTFTGYQLPFDEEVPEQTQGGWVNPLAAGDGSLIYPAVKSPNYVAGVSGWQITRDGFAEFNDVTVRGRLHLDGTTGKYLDISIAVGTPLVQMYPGLMPSDAAKSATDTSQFATYNMDVVNDHRYKLSMNAPTSTNQNTSLQLISANYENLGGGHIDMVGQGYTQFSFSPFALNVSPNVGGNGIITIMNQDIGRGWCTGTGLTANGLNASGVETTVLTLPSFTYRAYRCYKFVVSGMFKVTVAPNRVVWQIRKTNNAGQSLYAAGIHWIADTGTGYAGGATGYFLVGSVDITATLVMTLLGGGTYNAFINASTTAPFTFDVYDNGVAAGRVGPATLV